MWLSEKPEVQVLPGLPKIRGRELRQGGKSGGLRTLPKFRLAVVGAAEVLFTEGMDAITAVCPATP